MHVAPADVPNTDEHPGQQSGCVLCVARAVTVKVVTDDIHAHNRGGVQTFVAPVFHPVRVQARESYCHEWYRKELP